MSTSSFRFGSQFSSFYPFYTGDLTGHSAAQCHANWKIQSFPKHAIAYGNPGPCREMVSCLLSSIGEDSKADMASANIILGLAPTILGYICPTLAESALLASQRPVLAFLCTLGAPSVYQVRPFDAPSLSPQVTGVAMKPATQKSIHWNRVVIISVVQYVLVTAAVLNALLNSITLGTRTVISWKCRWQGLELSWVLFSVVAHGISAVSFHLSQRFETPSSQQRSSLIKLLRRELTPCFAITPMELAWRKQKERREITSSTLLDWLAILIAFVNFIFGTLVFSSTLLIGTLDAFGVLSRYLVSALVCRGVLMMEIWSLSRES